jgi:hypothetical protein
MKGRAAAAVVCAASALVCAAPGGADSGSGTYAATGQTYYFDLVNTGTVAWQFFYLVGPPGTTFIGATSSAEASARCVVGQPDGKANEIECGPLPLSAAPAHAHLGLVATLAAPVACGAPFQLSVSTASTLPFTRGSDVTQAGSCAAAAPTALEPPALHGTPVVGRTIRATPPAWSSAPTRVAYRWQRCATACTAIAGATGLKLVLTRHDAGRSVRLVATAIIAGTAVETGSTRLAVRARA